MTQRAAFQARILEKIGAPLLAAVAKVGARQQGGEGAAAETEQQEATRLAELINKTVQVSIGLAGSMDLKDADSDAIRLALAATVGPLVAGQYRTTGKVPGDGEVKRLVKALEAVLTFSDNFAPAAESAVRLDSLAPGDRLADENQIGIQYVGALVPVVNAVAAFPFGRAETKLVQEVVDRLMQKTAAMGEALLASEKDDRVKKRAELHLLKALATLYVECHEKEMRRLLALDEQARARAAEDAGGMLSLDPVWDAFDRRAAMVEVVARSAGPIEGSVTGKAPQTEKPAQSEAAASPQESAGPSPLAAVVTKAPKPQETPPPDGPQPEQPQESAAAPATQPPAGSDNEEAQTGGAYNPMSFFKPKHGGAAREEGEQ